LINVKSIYLAEGNVYPIGESTQLIEKAFDWQTKIFCLWKKVFT